MTPAVLRTILQSVVAVLVEPEGGLPVTVAETIEALEADGWRVVFEENDLRQLTHDAKARIVTVSGKLEVQMPPGVLRSVLQFAQLELGD